MLTAMRPRDRSKVVLLREDGLAWAEHLRQEAREGRLICEGCSQPVVVRAGAERLWNFAHKSASDCPKAKDPMEILECRALLYGWLRQRFPDSIQVEKSLGGLPRPLDCWVERPGKPALAWWLVPAAVKPDLRTEMFLGAQPLKAHFHTLFHARLLNPDPTHPGRLILSATLRELTEPSSYGPMYGGWHESLHFLDPVRRHVISCRGLWPSHPPQGYQATLLDHPLEEVKLHPRTGEFVHPGEYEAWKAFQEKRERQRCLENVRMERPRIEKLEPGPCLPSRNFLENENDDDEEEGWEEEEENEEVIQPFVPWPSDPLQSRTAEPRLEYQPTPMKPPDSLQAALLTCKACGAQTRDWVVRYGMTGLCKCRPCSR